MWDSSGILTVALMVLSLIGALLSVTLSNILHAIFGLALALFGIAGLFFVLNSPFVAVMEVLIYIGGISIAMIFAIMLSSVISKATVENTGRKFWSLAVAVLVFSGIAGVLSQTVLSKRGPAEAAAWEVTRLGENLMDRYNVVFETLSVVLLLAIIGAIVISKSDEEADV